MALVSQVSSKGHFAHQLSYFSCHFIAELMLVAYLCRPSGSNSPGKIRGNLIFFQCQGKVRGSHYSSGKSESLSKSQ